MSNYTYLTQEGYDRLKGELEKMKTEGRDEVAKAIAEAREKGDLSENAEYDAAKDAQGLLEMRIKKKKKTFAIARVIDRSQIDTSKVTVLSNVTIKNKRNGAQLTYQLVAQAEADLRSKKISVNSPMGAGLLGKKIGETATVQTPNGAIEFEIIEISL